MEQTWTDEPVASRVSIVALHGNGGGAFRFARVQPYIPSDVCFQVLTLPGFADMPADRHLRQWRDDAGYVHRQVLQVRAPRIVLGHGIGASILLELIQHDTAGINGIILHAPVGARLSTRLFPRLMAFPGAREAGRRLFASRLLRPIWRRLLFTQAVPVAYLDRFFAEYRQCTAFAQMFDLITPTWFASLRPVSMPATLLWGERERVLSIEQMQDYLALLPACVTYTVPHWDHFPMIEHPKAYAATVVSLAQRLLT